MIAEKQSSHQLLERFLNTLHNAGIKVTHQRLEIIKEVISSNEHPDAETIHNRLKKRLPMISLDTVYRNLWMFLDLKLISTVGTPNRSIKFDTNIDHHHHFICRKCGQIMDFYSNKLDQSDFTEEVKNIGRAEEAQINIKGVCYQCERSDNYKK